MKYGVLKIIQVFWKINEKYAFGHDIKDTYNKAYYSSYEENSDVVSVEPNEKQRKRDRFYGNRSTNSNVSKLKTEMRIPVESESNTRDLEFFEDKQSWG